MIFVPYTRAATNSRVNVKKITLKKYVMLNLNEVQPDNRTFEINLNVTLSMDIHGAFQTSVFIKKHVVVMDRDWFHMELRCLQNCHTKKIFESVPVQLVLYCPECYDPMYAVEVTWPSCNDTVLCFNNPYYSFVPQLENDTFVVQVKKDNTQFFRFRFKYQVDKSKDEIFIDDLKVVKTFHTESLIFYDVTVDHRDLSTENHVGTQYYNAFVVIGNVSDWIPWGSTFQHQIKELPVGFWNIHLSSMLTIESQACSISGCPNTTLAVANLTFGGINIQIQEDSFNDIFITLNDNLHQSHGLADYWMLVKLTKVASYVSNPLRQKAIKFVWDMLDKIRISYHLAEIVLHIIKELIILGDIVSDDSNAEIKNQELTRVKRAIDALNTYTTDLTSEMERKQCLALATLSKIFEYRKQSDNGLIFFFEFYGNLRGISKHILKTMSKERLHCTGKAWHYIMEMKILDDQPEPTQYVPNFYQIQELSVYTLSRLEFDWNILYQTIIRQPTFIDLVLYIEIYFTINAFNKPWFSHKLESIEMGSVIISMFRKLDQALVPSFRHDNSLKIIFDTNKGHPVGPDQKEDNVDDVLEIGYSIKGGEITSDCVLLQSFIFENPQAFYIFILTITKIGDRTPGRHEVENIRVTLMENRCSYLDRINFEWQPGVCTVENASGNYLVCNCQRSSGLFSGDISQVKNFLNQTVVSNVQKLLEFPKPRRYVITIFILGLWLAYLCCMLVAKTKDNTTINNFRTQLAGNHFNMKDRYRLLICVKTSAVPGSALEAQAKIILIGDARTSGEMLLGRGCHFVRSSESWFLASTTVGLGHLKGAIVKIDPSIHLINWCVLYLNVYDATSEQLYCLPSKIWFSNNKRQQVCVVDKYPWTSFRDRLEMTFGEELRNYHALLCIFIALPGEACLGHRVTRLFVIVLWSFVVTQLFIQKRPKFQFEDKIVEPKLFDTLFACVILLVINIVYTSILNLMIVNERWQTHLPKRFVPEERVTCDMSNVNYAIRQSEQINRASSQLSSGSTRELRKSVRFKELSKTNILTDSNWNDNWSMSLASKRDRYEKFFDDYRASKANVHRFSYRSLYMSGTAPPGEEWKYDKNTEQMSFTKGFAGCSTVKSNIAIAFSALNMILCTAFIVQTSWHQSNKVNVNLITSSVIVLCVEIFLLEPVALVFLAMLKICKDKNDSLYLVNKRMEEAREALIKQEGYREANYSNRLSYVPSWRYRGSGLNGLFHKHQMMIIETITKRKKLAVDRAYKGGKDNMVLILSAVVIMYLHANIWQCYLQKNMIYAGLYLNDDVEKPVVEINEIWKFLEDIYLPFFHSRNKKDSKNSVIIFTRIKQLRINPLLGPCEYDIQLDVNKTHGCYPYLTIYNMETRNFTFDWKNVTENNYQRVKDMTSSISVFRYTPFVPESVLEHWAMTYPYGGYEYIFSTSYEDNLENVLLLKNSEWVDAKTRAIFIDASIYDPNTGIASAFYINYIFGQDGIQMKYFCQAFVFLMSGTKFWVLAAALGALLILTIADVMDQLSKMKTFGIQGYLYDKENSIRLVIITLDVLLLVGFYTRFNLTSSKYANLYKKVNSADEALYVNFTDMAFIVLMLNYTSGFMALAGLLVFLRSASHIRRMQIMMEMLMKAFVMGVPPLLCIAIMANISYMILFDQAYEFSSMKLSSYTTMQFIISPAKVKLPGSLIGQVLRIIMWCTFFFVVTNGFLVSLNEHYSVLMANAKKKDTKSLLYSFILMLKHSLGFMEDESEQGHQIEMNDNRKPDRLLHSLSTGW